MKVFISYAHVDRAKVRSRVSALKDPVYEVFWDQSIPDAANWLKYLNKELNEASVLVVFVTAAAAASDYILDELSLARHRKVTIVPVYLEDVDDEEISTSPLVLLTRNLKPIMARRLSVSACCSRIREAILKFGRSHSTSCPIISVMGVQGGVGKSTMVMAMSELIASTGHNILLIDLDTGSAGLTRYLQDRAVRRPSIVAVRDVMLAHKRDSGRCELPRPGVWDVTPHYLDQERFGRILLIPARNVEDRPLIEHFESVSALAIVRWLVGAVATSSKRIDCVIIDCPADNTTQVSAGFVVANYGFIVSRAKTSFVSDIQNWTKTHRDRFPEEKFCELNVLVNMAISDTPAKWQGLGVSVKGFLPDSSAVRAAGRGDYDFEGIGLNNFFLAVLQVLITSFSNDDQRLLPDESKIWIKPYFETMKRFPESLLNGWKFRWLTSTSITIAALGVIIAGVSFWNIYKLSHAPFSAISRSIAKSTAVSESEAKAILQAIEIPADLANKVAFDREQGKFIVKTQLTRDETARLKGISQYEPWKDAVVEGSALAETQGNENLNSNQQWRYWLFVFGVIGVALLVSRGWSHTVLLKRKHFLQELVEIRNTGNDSEIENRIKELLKGDKQAKPHLLWVRDQFRQSMAHGSN